MLEVDPKLLGRDLSERKILLGVGSKTLEWDLPERREVVSADCWRGQGGGHVGHVGVQWLGWAGDGWTVVVGRWWMLMVVVNQGLTLVGRRRWKLIEALGDQSTLLGGTPRSSRSSRSVKGGFQGGGLACAFAWKVYLAS